MSDKEHGKPLIVPVFIPNMGCPHRCIFCQQETITARSGRFPDGNEVKDILDTAIRSPRFDKGREPEVAFYGGTFTRLSLEKIFELLKAVEPYIRQGLFKSIRVSTRPDSLDGERLDMLRDLGVSTVELGVQSMEDEVLALTRRGHTSRDTVESVHLLREKGFRVGVQLMPGLPGDSEQGFRRTLETVIDLRPDMARLYPAVVIRGTEMARWYREGRYSPLGLEEAVRICEEACMGLEGNGIPVIRIGLMSSPTLLEEGTILGGPWHTAFGFLVRSGIHQRKIRPFLPERGAADEIRIRAPLREIPLVRGYENRGLRMIEERTGAMVRGVIADNSLGSGEIAVDIIGDPALQGLPGTAPSRTATNVNSARARSTWQRKKTE